MSKEIPRAHWDWARLHLKEIFNLEPEGLSAFYSNQGLSPWQGAATWIEEGRVVAIQLREELRKGSYLRIYQRDEILAHEAVHAARAHLNSKKWEEFFAYMTSEKKWRRVLGPIVRNPWEVWPLIGFVVTGMFWGGGNLLAGIWFLLGVLRLMRGHWVLRRASKRLLQQGKDQKTARAILVRMTDEEIEGLAYFK